MSDRFSLDGLVAVVTGGTGVLGVRMAAGLVEAGARVAILGRRLDAATELAAALGSDVALAIAADVLDRDRLDQALATVVWHWGRVDILVNAAGGNDPAATVAPDGSLFDLPLDAWRRVIDLNLAGTLLPCQVFGSAMAERGTGTIVNISSMAAARPLTRVGAYGAAKAGVENLTRWLAVELPRRYGPGLRVNAIAPGFFIAEQNRALLVGADGEPTARGQAVLDHTPAGRFGRPEDLVSTLVWLCGPGAAFVNGTVIPVDGGFGAFSGV